MTLGSVGLNGCSDCKDGERANVPLHRLANILADYHACAFNLIAWGTPLAGALPFSNVGFQRLVMGTKGGKISLWISQLRAPVMSQIASRAGPVWPQASSLAQFNEGLG